MNDNSIILNETRIDWLTLTTWDTGLWFDVLNRWTDLRNLDSLEMEPVSIMGYKGFSYNGVWFMQREHHDGEHAGQIHTMIRVSGHLAHNFASFLTREKKSLNINAFRCTRIDTQVTIDGHLSSARTIVDILREHKGWGRGLAPSVTLIEGKVNTIYIGSRTSERYVRFYEKGDVMNTFTRFEIEYKGTQAEQVFRLVLGSISHAQEAMRGFFDRLPGSLIYSFPVFQSFQVFFSHSQPMPVRTIERDTNTVHWLKTQVDAAIRNLAGDHSTHNELIPLFQSWVSLFEDGER